MPQNDRAAQRVVLLGAGQHFLNLDIGLPVDQLRQAMRACIGGQSKSEQHTLAAVNRRGRTIRCQVSLTPFPGRDGGAGGVIVRMDQLDDST